MEDPAVALPPELLLQVLHFLDVNDLLSASRTCHHWRALSLDPLLHKWRLDACCIRVRHLLPRRPLLHTLQPPSSTIYLTRTHLAARRLHWSLVSIRLNRSLLRRPKLSTLVAANILPRECCRVDRTSGEFVWGVGVAGALVERKRRVEREQIKEGLRVWLERKAREIVTSHKKDGRVGVLVWRFSRKAKAADTRRDLNICCEKPDIDKEKVGSLRRFFESLGNARSVA
ncbi:hypothetical protein M409DRAFT_71132 [Zasmidium cellare ATCC 36951]|uniref:F-box domain-containing protein n=1 Tax=Zasmidium cellare ATCC 36951 TaxID=1080233 RepID=A0A6A6C092_ZASCE|nr:uncharacterized protein M409DRAFT_71132 [Zasmidium cellare ATCC 36951]KAF2159232.1 hypothetical protein M409DRAFT_71132 [Zasmidium cellare ATCC 36951]